MPKMKTCRAAAKRFSKTGSGKFKRRKKGLRHILTKHSRSLKNKRGKAALVSSPDSKRVSRQLPYA